MTKISALVTTLTLSLALFVTPTLASSPFQCAEHIAQAEAAIESAHRAMESLPKKSQWLVHTMIDDAKMWLHSSKHNMEKPAGKAFDLARSRAKADAARALAEAAEILAASYK